MKDYIKKTGYLSFAACIIIAIQIIIITFKGQAACFNEGCRILEGLTVIPPLYLNLLGFVYFQAIFWTTYLLRTGHSPSIDWLKILLISGLGVEGVLLAYQLFVARTLCSYCLIIFAVILVLNILAGRNQLISGAAVIAAILLIFSLLSFGPSLLLASRNQTLNAGTYGTRTCSNPAKQVYLFFSAGCPHCKKVIKALETCNSCDFHFNPVGGLKEIELADIEKTPSYTPEVNRLMLTLLGIREVPVLLAKDPSGFAIIKGEKKIISYIEQACYQEEPLLYLETNGTTTDQEMSVYGEEGGCSMTIDCDDGIE